jgi:hypothetical protein
LRSEVPAAAIDTIIELGEGPHGNWQKAHFGQFVDIFDEYFASRTSGGWRLHGLDELPVAFDPC